MNRYTLKAAPATYKPLTDDQRRKLVALRFALAKGRALVARKERAA